MIAMRTTRLGKTGLQVSRIGFGGIPIMRLSTTQAIEVVQHCLDLGVTFLDTANAYGTSEERIGQAIAGRREKLILATKTTARDKATAREHLELSLRQLGTEVIDLWQLHNVSSFEAYDRLLGPGGAMEAAQEALQAGMIKHIGITSHSMDVARVAATSGHFETIQFPFNFITSEPATELLPLVAEHDLGFIAMKPFGGGMLDDAQLAIKYLLQFENVVPDPGIETFEEIEEIVAIVAGPVELTPAEQERMARIRAEVGTRFCRRCGYCEPCPQGVSIGAALHIPGHWKRFPLDVMLTGWVAKVADSARNCIECGECEEKCPYHLPIREMLAESMDFYDRTVLGRTA
jgi:predicted aldo/keto reductase-like oxidoreductase